MKLEVDNSWVLERVINLIPTIVYSANGQITVWVFGWALILTWGAPK